MRTSANDVKRRQRGKDTILRSEPTPGSRLRKLYDIFLAHPLTPIHLDVIYPYVDSGRSKKHPGHAWFTARGQLANYELDIRKHSSKRWWLVATEEKDYLGEAVDRQA